jgi:hypothetical protein
MSLGACHIVPWERAVEERYAVVFPFGGGYCECYSTLEDFVTMKKCISRTLVIARKITMTKNKGR